MRALAPEECFASTRCGLHENFLPDLYLQSARWVSDILAEVPVTA
jgi:hypothetical protein